jgi:hypothetical protein
VLGQDGNLWLEAAQSGGWGQVPPPNRQHVDGGVAAFEVLSATGENGSGQLLVLGSDGNLWLEVQQNAKWGPAVPPKRWQVDGSVAAFQAISPTEIYVLGQDRNLWLESAQNGVWGQVPPPNRQHVDGNVSTFQALSATEALVLGQDGNLWLESAQSGGWGQVPPPNRQHVDGNVSSWATVSV